MKQDAEEGLLNTDESLLGPAADLPPRPFHERLYGDSQLRVHRLEQARVQHRQREDQEIRNSAERALGRSASSSGRTSASGSRGTSPSRFGGREEHSHITNPPANGLSSGSGDPGRRTPQRSRGEVAGAPGVGRRTPLRTRPGPQRGTAEDTTAADGSGKPAMEAHLHQSSSQRDLRDTGQSVSECLSSERLGTGPLSNSRPSSAGSRRAPSPSRASGAAYAPSPARAPSPSRIQRPAESDQVANTAGSGRRTPQRARGEKAPILAFGQRLPAHLIPVLTGPDAGRKPPVERGAADAHPSSKPVSDKLDLSAGQPESLTSGSPLTEASRPDLADHRTGSSASQEWRGGSGEARERSPQRRPESEVTRESGLSGEDAEEFQRLRLVTESQQQRIEFLEHMHQQALQQLRSVRDDAADAWSKLHAESEKALVLEEMLGNMQAKRCVAELKGNQQWVSPQVSDLTTRSNSPAPRNGWE